MNESTQFPSSLHEQPLRAAVDGLDSAASTLAQRSAEAVRNGLHDGVRSLRQRTEQLREQARDAGDMTLGYVRSEPLKAILIATAVGAGLMAVMSLLTRSRRD